MSDDQVPWSQDLGERWCPDCNPERDPLAEILVEDYCGHHRPSLAGLDDARVEPAPSILGNSETDGETQAGWARLLRG